MKKIIDTLGTLGVVAISMFVFSILAFTVKSISKGKDKDAK